MISDLPACGERMLPGMNNARIVIEHLHRYAMARHFCSGKLVLDIACGEGYGTNILSQVAKQVTGVDIDEKVIQYAKVKYKKANILFKQGSADAIPVDDKQVDVVVSFETLEHHDKHEEMMNEIKRVLKEDGVLIISTPDKKYYSDIPGFKNPYHVKELYSHEFYEMIKRYFRHVQMLSQSSGTMSLLFPFGKGPISHYWSARGNSDSLVINDTMGSEYLIAIASQSEFLYSPLSFFDGTQLENRIREEYITDLLNSRAYKIGNLVLGPLRWLKHLFSKKPVNRK